MFNYKIDESYESAKEVRKQKLLANETVVHFLNKHHLSIENINELSILEKYLRECKICQKCKGLDYCFKSPKGYTSDIEVNLIDGRYFFDEVKVKCNYLIAHEQEYEHLNYFIYNDIAEANKKLMIKGYQLDENNPSFIKLFTDVLDIASGTRKKGLYICGSMGIGKTYLCSALANALASQKFKVAYIKANNFMSRMSTLVIEDKFLFEDMLNDIKKADYLFIDDLGSEKLTNFLRDDVLFNILDYRMEQNLTTIINSNRSLQDLKLRYKEDSDDELKILRIIDRIEAMCEVYLLKGINYRHLK